MHVKKGDLVVIIKGKDIGRKGKVLSVDQEKGRVIVERINLVKRHTRPTRQVRQGGIIEKEAPVAAAKVMLFCSKCGRPVRSGHRFLPDGKKVRVCRRCGEEI